MSGRENERPSSASDARIQTNEYSSVRRRLRTSSSTTTVGAAATATIITGTTTPNTEGAIAGVNGGDTFTVSVAGNIDSDATIDTWHVSDAKTGFATGADTNDV